MKFGQKCMFPDVPNWPLKWSKNAFKKRLFFPPGKYNGVPIVCINNPGFFGWPTIQNASNNKNKTIEFYHAVTLGEKMLL